jgi:glycosyltransferase involved in cell wall biosynthesis
MPLLEFPDKNAPMPDGARPRICIVTSEIIGPHKNGGVGTAMTGLAETLAGVGFPVTILYTGGLWSILDDTSTWKVKYATIGIEFEVLKQADTTRLAGPLKYIGFPNPYLVYLFLRERRFDVIHFNDMMGEGYYCLVAKRLGIAFADSLLLVGLHSPSQWVLESNDESPNSILYAAFNFAERLSIRCADVLWAPSQYLVQWLQQRCFALPDTVVNQQYILPTSQLFEPDQQKFVRHAKMAETPGERRKPRELVFFARLEERKGIRLFCNALDEMSDLLAELQISVTFLGKSVTRDGISSLDFLAKRGSAWKFNWKIIADYGQQEAVQYLRVNNCLAVIPSPVDNSPCTVYEVLSFRIPFIASRTGGIPELIHREDQGEVLFDYSTPSLTRLLRHIIKEGTTCARPSVSVSSSRNRWIAAHHSWRDWLKRTDDTQSQDRLRGFPLLVIIDDLSTLEGVERTLASLDRIPVTSKDIAIVLIKRNSSFSRLSNFLANRQISIVEARCEDIKAFLCDEIRRVSDGLVIFIHAGVSFVPEALSLFSTMFNVAEIDGLIPAAYEARNRVEPVVPALGGSIAFGFFEGLSFTGGAGFKSNRLSQVLARNELAPEREFLGILDLAIGDGLTLWPLPEATFDLENTLIDGRPHWGKARRMSPFVRIDPTEAYYIAAIGYHAFANHKLLNWERRLWMQFSTTRYYRLANWTWRIVRGIKRLRGEAATDRERLPVDQVSTVIGTLISRLNRAWAISARIFRIVRERV